MSANVSTTSLAVGEGLITRVSWFLAAAVLFYGFLDPVFGVPVECHFWKNARGRNGRTRRRQGIMRCDRWRQWSCGRYLLPLVCSAVLWFAGSGDATWAQQALVTLPSHQLNDGFFERIGVGWNFQSTRPGSRMFFNYPGLNSALPFFGGWDPGTDARFGFAGRRGNTRFGFNMALQQGSSRTMTSVAPSVMVPHGGSASISSTTLRPFVTGWIPVVGQQVYPPMRVPMARPAWQHPQALSQLQQRQSRRFRESEEQPLRVTSSPRVNSSISTAVQGAISISEIRQQQLLEDQARLQEVEGLLERARGAEEAGKLGVARIYYQQAANRSDGQLKQLLLDRAQQLKRRKAALQGSPR